MTFSDPVPQISKVDVDRMLRQAQEQTRLLYELERTMNANRDYLTKVRCHPHLFLHEPSVIADLCTFVRR